MAGVRDFMRRIDARIYQSRIVKAIALIGTEPLAGAYFSEAREIEMPDGSLRGVQQSFECQYVPIIATLVRGDIIAIDDYGEFRFLREMQPGGDESGKTVIELGVQL